MLFLKTFPLATEKLVTNARSEENDGHVVERDGEWKRRDRDPGGWLAHQPRSSALP